MKKIEKIIARVTYWENRRNEATTIPELQYCRLMEKKAHIAWSKELEGIKSNS